MRILQQDDNSRTPDLESLTRLQHLQLQDATWLDTSMMFGMSRLTHLQLCTTRGGLNASCMPPLLHALSGTLYSCGTFSWRLVMQTACMMP